RAVLLRDCNLRCPSLARDRHPDVADDIFTPLCRQCGAAQLVSVVWCGAGRRCFLFLAETYRGRATYFRYLCTHRTGNDVLEIHCLDPPPGSDEYRAFD